MIKYLYGKSQYLDNFAKTGERLRFRDLFTMDKLQNEDICDNEANKAIELAPDAISKVIIAGREFEVIPDKPIIFSRTPRRCHVLCLSHLGNAPELFKLFKADICIGLDVTKMAQLIETANKHRSFEVIADSMTYYKHESQLLDLSQERLAFVKPAEPYSREHEYRIAIFWPNDESSTLKTIDDGEMNVFYKNGAPDDYIAFNFKSPAYEEIVYSVTRT